MARTYDYKDLDAMRKDTVTTVAYLLGVGDRYLYGSEDKESNFDAQILESLKQNDKATAIRYLSIVRCEILSKYGKIRDTKFNGPATESENFASCFDRGMLEFLSAHKMEVVYVKVKGSESIYGNVAYINQYLADSIDGIRDLFPDWIKFEYIKGLFLMPGGEAGVNGSNVSTVAKRDAVFASINAEHTRFMENRTAYPYKTYLDWPKVLSGYDNNIILNDQKFLKLLYAANGDIFKASEYVVDARQEYKQSFYSFVNSAKKVSIFVDCENVDPYAFVSMLMNMDKENLSKIEEIVLYDDVNTSEGWKYIEDYVDIDVKFTYNLMERVLDNKSLVDTAMATGACKAYYKDDVDSIVLASSDSDFWGLITQVPLAKYYILNERAKTSPAITDKFKDYGINYTFMDDFAKDKVQDFKEKVLVGALRKQINRFNETHEWEFEDVGEMVDSLFYRAYIKGPKEQIDHEKKTFFNKYLKKGFVIRCEEDEEGKILFKLDLNR